MRKENCEICGRRIELGTIERHHVVPTEVTEQAGLPESETLRSCSNCYQEVCAWYSAKVSGVVYDTGSQRFERKSQLEMIKEYESAFNNFMKYKKKR